MRLRGRQKQQKGRRLRLQRQKLHHGTFRVKAASARSRFQPQRAQNGLFARLKKRRSGTGEPQRGQVMLLMICILMEPFVRLGRQLRPICAIRKQFGVSGKPPLSLVSASNQARMIAIWRHCSRLRSLTVELPTAAGWVKPVNDVSLQIAAGETLGLGRRIGQREDHAFAGADGIVAGRARASAAKRGLRHIDGGATNLWRPCARTNGARCAAAKSP